MRHCRPASITTTTAAPATSHHPPTRPPTCMFLAMFLRASAFASALRPCGMSVQPLPMMTASTSEVGRYRPAGRGKGHVTGLVVWTARVQPPRHCSVCMPPSTQRQLTLVSPPAPPQPTTHTTPPLTPTHHTPHTPTCGKGAKHLHPRLGPDADHHLFNAVDGRLPRLRLRLGGRQVATQLHHLCRE